MNQARTRQSSEPAPRRGTFRPALLPVVVAIVTSTEGVLIGRRNDGQPPWTFPAGKIEPGKSPAEAAEREVKQETGLRVKAGDQIGHRVHPQTGRLMVYVAAEPTHGTCVLVAAADELAEVRWASLTEAEQLLPGMHEPVRAYLARVLPGRHRDDTDLTASDRLAAATRQAAASQAAAERAIAASVDAFRRSAEAHERAAVRHERSAASGVGDVAQHLWRAALHRAAAAEDRERAAHARSLMSDFTRRRQDSDQ